MNPGDQTSFDAMCQLKFGADRYVFLSLDKKPNRTFVINESKQIEEEERVKFNVTYLVPVYDSDQHLFLLNDYNEYIVLSL